MNASDRDPHLCTDGWRLRMRYLVIGLDHDSVRIYVDAFTSHVRRCAQCSEWARWIDAQAEAAGSREDAR